jgi:hypothetical protein
VDNQDDLRNRHRFAHSTRVVSGFSKRPHLPEAEQKLPQNVVFAAMVQVGEWQTLLGNTQKVRSKDQVGTHTEKGRLMCPVR